MFQQQNVKLAKNLKCFLLKRSKKEILITFEEILYLTFNERVFYTNGKKVHVLS